MLAPNLQFIRTNYVRQLQLFSQGRVMGLGSRREAAEVTRWHQKGSGQCFIWHFPKQDKEAWWRWMWNSRYLQGDGGVTSSRWMQASNRNLQEPARIHTREQSLHDTCSSLPQATYPLSWAPARSFTQLQFWASHFKKCGVLVRGESQNC